MNGDELRALREKAGMTQVELAKVLHVHEVTVARWESNARKIDYLTEIAIKRLVAERG